jgi:hypothetical protein
MDCKDSYIFKSYKHKVQNYSEKSGFDGLVWAFYLITKKDHTILPPFKLKP